MSLKNSLQHSKANPLLYHQKTYQEIIHFLNSNWHTSPHTIIQSLNQALGNLSSKLTSIIIAGTHEKNTTIHYLEEILQARNITTGSFCSPHVISYNERFKINGKAISNEDFTNAANKVLQLTQELQLTASSKDILTAMALIMFHKQNVTLSIFQQDDYIHKDPVTICMPIVLGIPHIIESTPDQTLIAINAIIDNISDKTHVIAADQNKSSLKIMAARTDQKNGIWVMPIRKVAPLAHPFGQLFGRYCALADRIVQTYLDYHAPQPSRKKPDHLNPATSTSINKKTHVQATEQPLHHKKIKNLQLSSLDFWLSINNYMPNKFETLTQEDTTIVLDSADNLDDFNNLFLGVRLLNYQHNFDSISLIVGCIQGQCQQEAFIKLLKSYFKKHIQFIGLCPISCTIGEKIGPSWDIQRLTNIVQQAKLTAIYKPDLESTMYEILQRLKNAHDPFLEPLKHKRKNLIIITGSHEIITQYRNISNKKQSREII